MIHIRLDDRHAIHSLARIAHGLQKSKALNTMLGEALMKIHRNRFDNERQSPSGEAWKPLSPAYAARKQKNRNRILVRDGTLRNTLRYQADERKVVFGSDRKYARVHHFGSGNRTGKGSSIPARPWLGLSRQNEDYLLQKTQHFIQQLIARS